MKALKTITKACVLAISLPAISHAAMPENSVYLELGGNAAGYSVNYERLFPERNLGLRAGLGALWSSHHAAVGVPVLVNKYWGNANSHHKFETGVGTTFFSAGKKSNMLSSRASQVMGTATLGYRYIPSSNGMTFKAAFTPIFNQNAMIPWVGFSIGHSY
jgi:hypothetical protein